jgi:all-trans-retinol 13,14-reductase
VGGALMAGVLTASRMLGWRGYKVGKLLKSWKAQAPSDVSTTADVAG